MLFVIGFTTVFGQTNSSFQDRINYDKGIGIETFYQKNFGVGIGGLIGNNMGHKIKSNYSIGIYTDLFFVNSPIIGPRVKLNYNYLGIFGVNLNFSNYYRKGDNDFRITPEVNFSLYGLANIFVGYSFKIGKLYFPEINEYRVGVNLSIM
jgi:hypothetical protein